MIIKSTAIHRNSPSLPARWLLVQQEAFETPGGRWLDYGCGYGFDADTFCMEKYDPLLFPDMPYGKFDGIICTYVLCTVSKLEDRYNILEDIYHKLKNSKSRAYISVRRDIKYNTKTQFKIKLNLPIIHEDRRFCMYVMDEYSIYQRL